VFGGCGVLSLFPGACLVEPVLPVGELVGQVACLEGRGVFCDAV
jgi:hypothetical protein